MTKSEKQNWISNIENTAFIVAQKVGQQTVNFIFQKYGSQGIYDLNSHDYQAVWNELYFYEIDD